MARVVVVGGARQRIAERAAVLMQERAARREADAKRAVDEATREFWDNVDTSGGVDACHPWTGVRGPCRNADCPAVYDVGRFSHPHCASTRAHRVAVFLTFGRELPPHVDVVPLCDDHCCINVRHFALRPKTTGDATYITPEEFFCASV